MTKINLEQQKLIPVNAQINKVTFDDNFAVNVVKNPEIELFDEATYAKLSDIQIKDGEINVKVYSQLLPDAPEFARGFIGVAFRIDESDSKFESFYVRPTNGKTNDPIRKKHAVQYFSYPDYKFDVLREKTPNIYEAPADIGLNEWIDLKIVIEEDKRSLYINQSANPVLVVDALKGGMASGSIALWCDVGTDAYFKDLVITDYD